MSRCRCPRGACLDVLGGVNRDGEPCWFVRCYGVRRFKSLQGRQVLRAADSLATTGSPQSGTPRAAAEAACGTRACFPPRAAGRLSALAVDVRPGRATTEQKRAWLAADRYSAAEIAGAGRSGRVPPSPRRAFAPGEMRHSLRRMFGRRAASRPKTWPIAHGASPTGARRDLGQAAAAR